MGLPDWGEFTKFERSTDLSGSEIKKIQAMNF
jgi:hypothetical protein